MKKIAIVLGLILVAQCTWAGVVMIVENRVVAGDPGDGGTSRVSIDGRKIRMDLDSEGGQRPAYAAIFNGAQQKMWHIDHAQRSYMIMDKESMDAMAGQIGAAMEQMRAQLADMPAEQRAMVEGMMGDMPGMGDAGGKAAPAKVVKTGQKKTIHGYPCVKYEIRRGDRKTAEVWGTSWKKAGISKDTFDVFGDMAEFYSGLTEVLRGAANSGMEWDTFAQFDKMDAYPVLIRDFDEYGEVRSETTFKSVEKKKLDGSIFEVPSGYRLRQMPGPGAMGGYR